MTPSPNKTAPARKLALVAVLVCLSMILNFFERLIPLTLPAPGAKLGLANMVVLTALYILPVKDAFLVVVLKSVTASWLFASFSAFLYSIAGSLLSFAVMLCMIRLGSARFSPVGVSVAGGVFHNVGQLLMASAVVHTLGIFVYLPLLVLTGAGTGVLTGLATQLILKYLKSALRWQI
ncbi:MAG: Gx transporter family protein [Peptococcaceae bacterium]|nr:Gx transporter family protein [Peptococcaceae bacterium]